MNKTFSHTTHKKKKAPKHIGRKKGVKRTVRHHGADIHLDPSGEGLTALARALVKKREK